MKKRFTWDSWNFDGSGDAYIVARSECQDRLMVPDYIAVADNLDPKCKEAMFVEAGWCSFQVRSDWEDLYGPHGYYVVERRESVTMRENGRRKPGWFPVWIIRKGDWY